MLCKICIDVLQFQDNPCGSSIRQMFFPHRLPDREVNLSVVIEVEHEGLPMDPESDKKTSSGHAQGTVGPEAQAKPGKKDKEITFGHHKSPLSLLKSADFGCCVCEAALQGLSPSRIDSLRLQEQELVSKGELDEISSYEEKETEFYAYAEISESQVKPGTYQLVIMSTDKPPAHAVFDMIPTLDSEGETYSTDYTGSDSSLKTAIWWVQSCIRAHKLCNKDEGAISWFPTRLLYLGDPAAHDPSVRLILTANEHPTGPYATLSHRWGGSKFIQLSRSNTTALLDEIPLEAMPRTFQDAILVSRKLGIRYLWIDSLCIIQDSDSRSDWLREAAVMDKVYSFSRCNLSASDAANSSIGLFWKHEPRTLDPTKVRLCLEGLKEGAASAECIVIQEQFWEHRIDACLVNRRGWVFQERVLAPRVLHFGRDQLFWECREHTACEKYPLGIPNIDEASFFVPLKTELDFYDLQDAEQNRWVKFNRAWKTIVEAYSKTQLTVSSDRLIAISGIAKRMATLGDNTYHAGLWRRDLEIQLEWRRDMALVGDEIFCAPRPLEYRAPSWSWASIDSPIMFVGWYTKSALVEVVHVVLEHATEDTTGLVTGGWLDLKGTLWPGWLSERGLNWHGWINWNLTLREPTLEKHSSSVFLDVEVEVEDPLAFDDNNAAKKIFFVPITTYETSLSGLLLRLRVDLGEGTFERIGWANFHDGPEEATEQFLLSMKTPQANDLPCLRCEGGKQVFRIV